MQRDLRSSRMRRIRHYNIRFLKTITIKFHLVFYGAIMIKQLQDSAEYGERNTLDVQTHGPQMNRDEGSVGNQISVRSKQCARKVQAFFNICADRGLLQ